MSDTKISEKTEEAIETAAAAEAAAAANTAEAAKAETAKSLAEAGEAATAAATGAKALADVTAAEIIKSNEEKIEWLTSNAEQTGISLKELRENQETLSNSIPAMLESNNQQLVESLKASLTPPAPEEKATANPADAAPGDQKKTEPEPEKKPKKKNWL